MIPPEWRRALNRERSEAKRREVMAVLADWFADQGDTVSEAGLRWMLTAGRRPRRFGNRMAWLACDLTRSPFSRHKPQELSLYLWDVVYQISVAGVCGDAVSRYVEHAFFPTRVDAECALLAAMAFRHASWEAIPDAVANETAYG